MSLRPQTTIFASSLGVRIAVGYSILALFSTLALMLIAYGFLASTLERADRDQVLAEMQSLRRVYLDGGLNAFEKAVLGNDRSRKNNPFFTRIAGASGEPDMVFFPQHWHEFDLARIDPETSLENQEWVRLPARRGGAVLEICSVKLPDGFHFQVGISTEERLADLAHLRETFLFVIIPLLILGLAGGALLAQRSLQPVQHLIRTVESIKGGAWDTRAPRLHNGDELDDLGRLFNEMLERINHLVRGMKQALDSVAHDLRTPMTRFRNFAEVALQQGDDPQASRVALQACVEQSDQILRMLNMLMDISEAESGILHLELREVDLSDLIETVAEMYGYVGEEKAISIDTVTVPQLHVTLDPERISQALANLLDNAVKYTPRGGRVAVTAVVSGAEVLIRVTDTGIGIDPADLERIWERLYRGRNQAEKGIGLGLSLVRAVVAAHDGRVAVCNIPAGGACFEMTLPIR